MRAAVLIIGSLFWRQEKHRIRWRATNLDLAHVEYVKVPIRYRRLSLKSQTYTMGFAARGYGRAIVVPCKRTITNIASLAREAEELWGAETNSDANSGLIATGWGSVAVLFRRGLKQSTLAVKWENFFKRCRVQPDGKNPISPDGHLKIPWPRNAAGKPAKFDILLATSNVVHNASAKRVAEAWLRHKHEDYFFNNVAAGIRTPLDDQIWQHLARENPWQKKYSAAVRALTRKAGKR